MRSFFPFIYFLTLTGFGRLIFLGAEQIKWIPYYGKDLSAVNMSFYEKIKKFGFCLVLDEYGGDKNSKAELAVIDTVMTCEKPNILVICAAHLMHSWYRSLVSLTGVDFKMISGASRAITYYDKDMANAYIVSDKALANNPAVLKQFASEGAAWDLIILDAGLAAGGVDVDLYIEHIKTKTQRLVVFSPIPCGYQQSYDNIRRLVKELMADEEKAGIIDSCLFDKSTAAFDLDIPMMRYFPKSVYEGNVARNVVMLRYKFDDDFLAHSRRLIDIKTGIPLYRSGGNIFEEYGLEAKKIYTKPSYNLGDVNDLRAVDKKLDCFLAKLDEVMEDDNARVAIYCTTGSTISYLKKVIQAYYPNVPNLLKIDRGDIFYTEYKDLLYESKKDVKIVITVDRIGSINPAMKKTTHVFNYEIPDTPVLLEQRAARHSVDVGTGREFILFTDDNGLFDRRMISRVLFGQVYKSIVSGLPGRNVIFDIPDSVDYIVDCIRDIQYVCGYTGEVSSARDVIVKFESDYNLASDVDVSSAARTNEYTTLKLDKIYHAFGIENSIRDLNTDEKTLRSLIKPALDRYKNCLVYLDENQRIIEISDSELKASMYNSAYNAFEQGLMNSEMFKGLEGARNELDRCDGNKSIMPVRECVDSVSDSLKLPVLLHSWRYLKDQLKVDDDLRVFMKKFNEGVI